MERIGNSESNCPEGQFRDEDGTCKFCAYGCFVCDNLEECKQCFPGFGNFNGTCTKCIDHCDNCKEEEPELCYACPQYFQKDDKNQCEHCEKGCLLCHDGICEECGPGYWKNGTECVKLGIDHCPFGEEGICVQCEAFYGLNDDGECQKCADDNCFYCDFTYKNCTGCRGGYVLTEEGTCEKCLVPNCADCDLGENYCYACDGKHILSDDGLSCEKECPIENCFDCNDEGCMMCNEKYFLNEEGKCEKCADNCLQCYYPDICLDRVPCYENQTFDYDWGCKDLSSAFLSKLPALLFLSLIAFL